MSASPAILFNNIPGSGLSAPIFTFEVNSGGQYEDVDRFVLLGHITAAGLMALNTPTPVSDQNTADQLCGPGSMLREMFRIATANAPATPIWLVGVADAGVAPQWQLSIGSLPGVGTGIFQICGEQFQITFGPTDTPATIAAAIAAAVNGYYNPLTDAQLPITASAASNVVTFASVHKGLIMNAVDFYVPTNVAANLFNSAGVWSLTRTIAGSGSPTVANALAALQDNPADLVVAPWSDSNSLAAYTAWGNDVSGRWAWSRQSYGHVGSAMAGSFSALVTQGLSMNDRHTSLIGKIAGVAASGNITFTGQPTNGQAVTIGGTAVTFVTSGATGLQVNIGGTQALSVAALLAFLQASSDPNLIKCTYNAVGANEILIAAALDGEIGNALTLATTITNASVSGATLSGGLNGSPHPSWLWAAGMYARVAPWLFDTTTGNVSRNQTGLVVEGLAPPRDQILVQQYSGRNTLINSGISTWKVGADGSVQVDKLITTYRTGTSGNPDIVFRDIQAMFQVSGALKYFRAQIGAEQANKALAPLNPGNLGAIATPADIKASFVNAYGVMVNQGVLQNLAYFAQNIVVDINAQNPDRCDVFAPMARVNPLDILAANATIYQQFPTKIAA